MVDVLVDTRVRGAFSRGKGLHRNLPWMHAAVFLFKAVSTSFNQ